MRAEKHYLALDMNWDEFCKQKIGISRATADRLIRHLDEFGAQYFEFAAVANLPVEQYRMIAPAVTDGGLLCDGETIEIKAENAPRLTAAIEKLRERAAVEPPPAGSGELVKTWGRARKALADAVQTYTQALALATAPTDREALRGDLKRAGLELYERGALPQNGGPS